MKTASIAKTLLSVAFAAATVTFVQAQPKESAIVAHRGYWNCKEGATPATRWPHSKAPRKPVSGAANSTST